MLKTPAHRQYSPTIPQFHIIPKFIERAEREIQEISDSMSTGMNGVFVESLRPAENMFALLNCNIWP